MKTQFLRTEYENSPSIAWFNRLDYFENVNKLRNNPEAHQVDLHVYLDRPKRKAIRNINMVNESKFQNPVIVTRDENLGIGRPHRCTARTI